jgi:hypothetical protein
MTMTERLYRHNNTLAGIWVIAASWFLPNQEQERKEETTVDFFFLRSSIVIHVQITVGKIKCRAKQNKMRKNHLKLPTYLDEKNDMNHQLNEK